MNLNFIWRHYWWFQFTPELSLDYVLWGKCMRYVLVSFSEKFHMQMTIAIMEYSHRGAMVSVTIVVIIVIIKSMQEWHRK